MPKLKVITAEPPDPHAPPRDPGEHGLALWNSILSEYQIDDPAGRALLALACESLDRADNCRAEIEHDGQVIRTKTGLRDHPLLKHELGARAFCARAIRQLGLDVEPIGSIGRPPGGGRR